MAFSGQVLDNTISGEDTPGIARPAGGLATGPPKLSAPELRLAQRQTLRGQRLRQDPVTWILVMMVDLIYGRRASLAKFRVLELLAPVPYQAWERAAYRALTRLRRHDTLARRVFEAMAEARAQQDNETFHLLILEDLLQSQGFRLGLLRHRLLPLLMAGPYRVVCWALFLVRPAWSYRLNASFEDHAEHQYMAFVAAHPELERQIFASETAAEYGRYDSVADLLRQIGHDERIHKLESLHSSCRAWRG